MYFNLYKLFGFCYYCGGVITETFIKESATLYIIISWRMFCAAKKRHHASTLKIGSACPPGRYSRVELRCDSREQQYREVESGFTDFDDSWVNGIHVQILWVNYAQLNAS